MTKFICYDNNIDPLNCLADTKFGGMEAQALNSEAPPETFKRKVGLKDSFWKEKLYWRMMTTSQR